jgi:hypothetical protein
LVKSGAVGAAPLSYQSSVFRVYVTLQLSSSSRTHK